MSGVHPIEVELKYRVVEPGAADRFLAADALAGFAAVGGAHLVQHDDRYVDTPDGALARGGFSARLRSTGSGLVIGLKSLRATSTQRGEQRREDLEGPADPALPPSDWPSSAARSLIMELAGDAPLVEVVTVRQSRRKRKYQQDTTLLEVSLDEVDVVVRGQVVDRFEELEIEVVDGDDDLLGDLNGLLAETRGLVPAESSKMERALQAVHRDGNGKAGLADVLLAQARDDPGISAAEPTRPSKKAKPTEAKAKRERAPTPGAGVVQARDAVKKAEPAPDRGATDGEAAFASPEAPALPGLHVDRAPGVLAEDHIAEAGRKVLRFHLARMLAVEPGTRSGQDPEDLHKMRVATRRQRAAWRVFGHAYDGKRTKRYRIRLRDVARRLGAVRDLDVLIEHAVDYQKAQSAAEARAFEPLVASWRTRRDGARALLIQELDSDRHARWLEAYRAFVQSEGRAALPVAPTEAHRVRDTMPSRIWAAYEGVRAYEPALRWADVTTLHDLRIASKWLRYTLEFVREALGPEAGPLIDRVVAMQDHLGLLNDADVAAGLARRFLVEHTGELHEHESAAIARYLVDRERELARLRRAVGPPWRGVAGLTFRRQLGRLVAGL